MHKRGGDWVWIKQLEIPKNGYGHASSLICHEGLVIAQYDQIEDSKLLAFDIATGKPAWKVERSAISWSSPILVDNNGRMELILTNCESVDSYNPETGKHLWRVKCLKGEVATSAAYANGVVFVANEGSPATAIDISHHDQEPEILWQWDEVLPDAASPLAEEDYVRVRQGLQQLSNPRRRSRLQYRHDRHHPDLQHEQEIRADRIASLG